MDPMDCAGTCCERKIKPAGFRAKLNRRRHESALDFKRPI
jgi:hypothetical protein